RLAHKDVALANALGSELGMPMRMCNLALAEMTEALTRGWGGRDSRAVMLLQQERAGVEIAVDPERLRAALTSDAQQDSLKHTCCWGGGGGTGNGGRCTAESLRLDASWESRASAE